MKRVLGQPVTLKTVITQDIREQGNVGIPLLWGYSSNRTLILAIRKKLQTFPTGNSSTKTKMMRYPLSK